MEIYIVMTKNGTYRGAFSSMEKAVEWIASYHQVRLANKEMIIRKVVLDEQSIYRAPFQTVYNYEPMPKETRNDDGA
jgi:hypothetical protein